MATTIDSTESRAELQATESLARIVAILPRGEAIRNFVYSGALDGVARLAKLSVLSVKPSDDIWTLLGGRFGEIELLGEAPERWPVRFLREILDMAHGRWLWSEAAQERWRLRDQEATTLAMKLKRFGRKVASRPFASRRGLAALSRLERAASYCLSPSDRYLKLYRRLRPSLVFNGSHVHSSNAIQAVQAARWLGIPTAAFIFSWDNLTSQGRVLPAYDYYLVWNDTLREQLLDMYRDLRPEQVFVTGTPQFDFHFRQEFYWTREEFCRRVGADPRRPIVLYSTGMPNHMPGEERIVEGIARLLRGMTELGSPQLLLRVYAKDRTGRFEPLRRSCPDVLMPAVPWDPNWLTPHYDDAFLLTNTLRHAALGINVASTVSLELCMFDKPVINVGYNPLGVPSDELEYARYYKFDHYRPIVESGAVEVAGSEAELECQLCEALIAPAKRSTERRALIAGMFGDTLDGRSGERVAERLISLTSAGAANSRGLHEAFETCL